MPDGWRITVRGALKAHFLQGGGPSRPCTDWSLELQDGAKQYRIIVRAFAEDVAGLPAEQEAMAVAGFVGKLIEEGWTPLQWTGKPGELTLPKGRT